MDDRYLPLIRSLRPRSWDEVIGQNHVVRGLSRSLADERVKNGYMFTGDKGLGKTTTARLISAVLNCPNREDGDPNPCGECETCNSVFSGHSMFVTEVDCGTHGSVDDMRSLTDKAQLGSGKKFRIFILDEFHLASNQAKTSILKSLEEPNRNVVWVICTSEPQKVPSTIRSRCASYEFRHVAIKVLSSYMKTIIEDLMEEERYDEDAVSYTDVGLRTIVELADGSVRESLSILEAVLDHGDGITEETIRDVSGRATSSDVEVMIKAIISGNLDHAGKLMRDVYNSQTASTVLKYLFSVILPRSGGMKSIDRRNAVLLIRAITEYKPTFHESVNRDLLLFAMFDAIHNTAEVSEAPAKKTGKKTTSAKKTTKKKKSDSDPDADLVAAFIEKLEKDRAPFEVQDEWNGKYCIILIGRKQARLAVTKVKDVDASYLLPLKKLQGVVDSDDAFSAKALVDDGIIVKKKT